MPQFFSRLYRAVAESVHPMTVAPVSVVIPCYRHAETLERAIASVAEQSARALELIVVNDGGCESIGNALKDLQIRYGANWLVVVTLPQNVGAGEARNAGWAVAKGEYVAFLDADDAWHPRKIEIQYGYMENHPDVAVCGHRHRQEINKADWNNYELTGHSYDIKLTHLLLANRFITSSGMVRCNIEARFATKQRYMEDFRLWLTVAARGGRIVKLEDELACIYKAIFGESGLSADMLRMEIGEIQTYWAICRETHFMFPVVVLLVPYSLLKFLRRLIIHIFFR